MPQRRPPALGITIVRGLRPILEHGAQLTVLAEHSGQRGAVDYLEYILTAPYVGPKIPTLLLFHEPSPAPSHAAPTLRGAVLLYQYRAANLDTGIFVTDDDGGERTVLAPPALRPTIAAAAACHLLRHGARLLHLILRADATATSAALVGLATPSVAWATRDRLFRSVLPLASTYDDTLANLGKHTRRNLRYYERRVSTELGATFVLDPQLSEHEFLDLNRRFPYPVPDRVALWRLRNAQQLPGGFMLGLQCRTPPGQPLPDSLHSGDWLSLLGGRRHHRTAEIAWQMNRSELEAFSITTAMRSLLIRHEVTLGTERLAFDGGTPHSIHTAFLAEPVLDLLITRRSPPATLLRHLAPRLLPEKNALADLLRDPTLAWHTA